MKIGQQVKATSARNGVVTVGRVHAKRSTERNGDWIDVNISPKGRPAVIKTYRPKMVVPV